MTSLPLVSLFKVILDRKSAFRFLLGTVFSLSFSVAVILATIGLMDGYSVALKKALSLANGDIKVKTDSGFFLEKRLNENVTHPEIKALTSVLQVEAFALAKGQSKGVILKGVESKGFKDVTGLSVNTSAQKITVGSEFAKKYDLVIGDEVVLVISVQSQGNQPQILPFSVGSIIQHGIYEKDFRFFYLDKKYLEEILNYRKGTSNIGLVKLKQTEKLDLVVESLKQKSSEFMFQPFWAEQEVLLEAVEIERDTISLALQLIVLVSVINIIALLIFISEVKSQDIFLLRALGLSIGALKKFWYVLLFVIWCASAFIGQILVWIFDNIILQLPFLKIPGDIYKLSELKIILSSSDYFMVLGLSMAWIFSVGFLTLRKLQAKSLIAGLRQEFS